MAPWPFDSDTSNVQRVVYYDRTGSKSTPNLSAYSINVVDDDRITQRNAASREALAELVQQVNAPHARRQTFAAPVTTRTRCPRFRRPQKRSRGPVGVY